MRKEIENLVSGAEGTGLMIATVVFLAVIILGGIFACTAGLIYMFCIMFGIIFDWKITVVLWLIVILLLGVLSHSF